MGLMKQVSVQTRPSAVKVALPAFAAERAWSRYAAPAPAATHRYFPARMVLSSKAAGRCCCCCR